LANGTVLPGDKSFLIAPFPRFPEFRKHGK
jgi:hypothetical protein